CIIQRQPKRSPVRQKRRPLLDANLPPSLLFLLPPFVIRSGRRKSQVSAALRPVCDLHSREATRLDSFSLGVDR
ncbi:unnamed protein product, partial [Musa hybrid cultivar]